MPFFLIIWQVQNIRAIANHERFFHYGYFGFPLVWIRNSYISLYSDVYILPTLANIIVLGIVSYLVDKLLMSLLEPFDNNAFAVPVWIVGVLSLTHTCLLWFILDVDFYCWYNIKSV